jgi:16S rRNA (uracil1498-N3)-methyltransferase
MNSLILKKTPGNLPCLIHDPLVLRHIHETLKLAVGDSVRCTLLDLGLTIGIVKELSVAHCLLELGETKPGGRQWFDLIVGVSRPQTSKKILEHSTTFGARRFHFFKAQLSEKSYLDSKVFESYDEFLCAGLSQSALYDRLPAFSLEKYNPADQYKAAPQKFILDLKAEKTFSDFIFDWNQPVTLAIGPERGWTPKDIQVFHDAGFMSVKISSSILRVEHAVYSAISQLELLRADY